MRMREKELIIISFVIIRKMSWFQCPSLAPRLTENTMRTILKDGQNICTQEELMFHRKEVWTSGNLPHGNLSPNCSLP